MEKKKKSLQLKVRYELAYEIIFNSLAIILFGISFLFATNLLRFNWYTVFFAFLTAVFLYLKNTSYLIIEDDQLKLIYFKFYQAAEIKMDYIQEFIFYENKPVVGVKTSTQGVTRIYLRERNKKRLLDWLIQQCPEISALYISQNQKNS